MKALLVSYPASVRFLKFMLKYDEWDKMDKEILSQPDLLMFLLCRITRKTVSAADNSLFTHGPDCTQSHFNLFYISPDAEVRKGTKSIGDSCIDLLRYPF